jgi:hypothetical protein
MYIDNGATEHVHVSPAPVNSEVQRRNSQASPGLVSSNLGTGTVAQPQVPAYPLCTGANTTTIRASREVLDVIKVLCGSGRFDADQFTVGTVRRIARMMKPSHGKMQLTVAKIKRYQQLIDDAYADDKSMAFDEVQIFLSCWKRIWKECLEFKYGENFRLGVEYLQGNAVKDLDLIKYEAETVLNDVNVQVMLGCSNNQVEALLKVEPEVIPGGRGDIHYEIARFELSKQFGPDMAPVIKHRCGAKLKKAIGENPMLFFRLRHEFPLEDWASLTRKNLRQLVKTAAREHGIAHTYKKFGAACGIDYDN